MIVIHQTSTNEFRTSRLQKVIWTLRIIQTNWGVSIQITWLGCIQPPSSGFSHRYTNASLQFFMGSTRRTEVSQYLGIPNTGLNITESGGVPPLIILFCVCVLSLPQIRDRFTKSSMKSTFSLPSPISTCSSGTLKMYWAHGCISGQLSHCGLPDGSSAHSGLLSPSKYTKLMVHWCTYIPHTTSGQHGSD
jgi:hypothetical protein